jgi:hypothetical protein
VSKKSKSSPSSGKRPWGGPASRCKPQNELSEKNRIIVIRRCILLFASNDFMFQTHEAQYRFVNKS